MLFKVLLGRFVKLVLCLQKSLANSKTLILSFPELVISIWFLRIKKLELLAGSFLTCAFPTLPHWAHSNVKSLFIPIHFNTRALSDSRWKNARFFSQMSKATEISQCRLFSTKRQGLSHAVRLKHDRNYWPWNGKILSPIGENVCPKEHVVQSKIASTRTM